MLPLHYAREGIADRRRSSDPITVTDDGLRSSVADGRWLYGPGFPDLHILSPIPGLFLAVRPVSNNRATWTVLIPVAHKG